MGISLLFFSLLIPLIFTVSGTNGKSPACIPDVTLPVSCGQRKTEPVPSGASVETDVTFIIYTAKTEPNAKDFIIGDDESFNASGYNTSAGTKIIIHGYFSSAKNFEHMVYAYLTATDQNLILMDWSNLSKWCYCEHVLKTIEGIGKRLGMLIEYLVEKGTKLQKIHIIGHSLGAHIAGIGSVTCSKGRVGRITALDPARPGFTDLKNPDRLHKDRADLVDVIHTSAHTFGIAEPLGHYDFYPNGGQAPQPGCTGVAAEICSHSRAHYLFSDSITTDVGYRALKCSTWTSFLNSICTSEHAPSVYMGERINIYSSEEGSYYLITGAVCPYYVIGNNAGVIMISALLIFSSIFIQIFQR